jgi:alpha-galactosidase
MLEVGNGGLNFEENRSHFSLWCMMAAPLILGNDVRKFIQPDGSVDTKNNTLQIVTNKNMIAVNQDKLGVQARRIETNLVQDTLVKPLENNEIAICFFNKSSETKPFSIRLNAVAAKDFVDLPFAESYEVTDLWSKITNTVADELKCSVAPHGVKVYRVRAN